MEKQKNDEITINLMSLLKTLWQKIYIILIAIIIAGGVAYYVSAYRTAPIYKADVYMYVNNSSLSFVGGKFSFSPAELDAAHSLVDTYSVILKSRTTLNDVITRANLDMSYEQLRSKISTQSVDQTEIFKISVSSTDANEAKYIANTIADVLPESISKIVDGSSVRVVDYAVKGTKVSPNVSKNTMLAMLMGAIVSAGIIIAFELANDTIRDKDYLMDNYDIPVLSVIPTLRNSDSKGTYTQRPKNAEKSGKYDK